MADFDIDAYLNRKLGSPAPDKIDAIMQAKEAKIADLQKFREAFAAQNPDTALREQAIRDGRTGGEFVKDVGLSLVQGLDSLAKLPAMVYDKATTGDFYGPETQAISAMSDEREKLKSAFSQAKTQEKLITAKESGAASEAAAEQLFGEGILSNAAGVAAEFGTSFWESLKDPEALPEFIAQQVAQLGVMGKLGRGAELAAQSAAKLAPKVAATAVGKKILENSATAGAVGFGATLQGVDSGSDTMQRLMSLPDDVWAQNPEFMDLVQSMEPAAAKQEIASRLAGEATLKAAGASLASSMLPGGNALEKAIVGKQRGSFTQVVPQAFRGEAVQEGLEEGSGAYFANKGVQAVNPNQDSLEGVGASAGQGAFLGGVLGGGIAGLSVPGVNKAADEEVIRAKSADFQKAAETGDTSSYLDKESKSYDPAMAVGVLFRNSELEATTDEAKQQNLAKAGEIVSELQAKRDALQTELDGGPSVKIQELQQEKAKYEEELKATDPTQTELVSLLEQQIVGMDKDIELEQANPASKSSIEVEISKLDRYINQSSTVLGELGTLVQEKITDEDLVSTVAVADTVVDQTDTAAVEQSQTAAQRVINLSMASPERVDVATATQLANNQSNGLTTEQRTYLRTFTEARVTENSLKDLGKVSENILVGGKGFLGINNYRNQVTTALAAGNSKIASKLMGQLNSFIEDHTTKSEKVQEAYAQYQKTGEEFQVRSDGNRGWRIEPKTLTEEERAKEGAVFVEGKTVKLVSAIPTEAKALQTAASELQQAYDLKFNKPSSVPTVAPSTVPAAQTTATPSSAAPTVSVAPASISTELAKKNSYITDAPEDYNPAVVQQDKDWAVEQKKLVDAEVARVESTINDDNFDNDAYDALTDVQTDLRLFIQKATEQAKNDRDMAEADVKNGTNLFGGNPDVGVESAAQATLPPNDLSVQTAEVGARPETSSELPTVTEPTSTIEEPAGKLEVLQAKSPEGAEYNQRTQLLGDFITQDTGREGDTSKRPLVAVKNFISTLFNKDNQTIKVKDFLQEKDQNLDEKQKAAILNLRDKFVEWAPVIKNNLVKGYFNKAANQKKENPDFAYQDLTQFLIQGTNETGLDVEENVKIAMTYGAINSVVSAAEMGPINTPKTINLMLGRDGDAAVSDGEMSLLADKGMLENLWRNRVGQAAVAALGFKATEGAPADLIPRLETAFGAHIQKLLMDKDLLVRNIIPAADVQEALGEDSRLVKKSKEKAQDWQLLRLAFDAENNLPDAINEIVQANKGAKSILDKLFSVDSAVDFPSLEPVPMTQSKASGVNEGIPSNIAKAVEEKQQEKNYMNEDMWSIIGDEGGISEDTLLEIAGALDLDPKKMHKANRKANEAKNNGLLRDIQRYKAFVKDYLMPSDQDAPFKTPFFFKYSVKKQQRVHIDTAGFNPQQSKIHRQLTYKDSWKSKIDFNNQKKLDLFKLVVSAGLGVNLDNEVGATTLSNFEKLFTPELNSSDAGVKKATAIRDAIKVLQDRIYEGAVLTDENQKTLIAGVKAGKENMQSFGVLVSMAHYMQAKETNQTSFTTQLQGEVDGKTNGIILSQLLYGGAESLDDMQQRMRRGGFYFEGDTHEQYNSWRSEGNSDSYESLTKGIVGIASEMARKSPQVFAAVYTFTKQLEIDGEIQKAGRDLTKNPLTTMMFGAALYSAVDKMADKLIANIYARIEEASVSENTSELREILNTLNTLLVAGDAQKIRTDISLSTAMETEISKEQIKAIKKAFHKTLGAAASQAIKQDYTDYLRNRDLFNTATKLTYDLSNAVISAEREAYIAELVAAKTLAVNKQGEPIRALSKAEEKVFQKRISALLPKMHTVGSKRDGKLSNGLLLANTERKLSNNPAFQSKVQFGSVFADKGTSSVEAKSSEVVTTEPSLGPSSKSVHSLDSSISHDAQQNREVHNNHDALVGAATDLATTAQALNEATWNNLQDYSPIGEVLESLKRAVTGIVGLSVDAANRKLSDKAMDNVAKVLNDFAGGTNTNGEQALNDFIKQLATSAYEADKLRLETLSKVVAIDQYTMEGGSFKPTEAQRNEVKERLVSLSSEVTLEVFQGVDTLANMLGDKLTTRKTLTSKATGKSVFGDLADSQIASDQDFVGVFEKRGSLNPKQLVHLLRKKFAENTVNREILEKLAPLLNDGLVIQYVTPDTKESDVLKLPNGPSRGWYVATKEGKQAIYVLSPEFGNSGLTPELLLHELIHAALAQTINNPSRQAKKLVKELETLLTEAKTIVEGDASLSKFKDAVSNVDELVSWGMTNHAFQVKVLSKIQMQSQTSQNRLVTGMKAFLDTVTKFLFRNPSRQQQNGVTILFQNVSGLMAATANGSSVEINQSMAADPVGKAVSMGTLDILEGLNNGTVDRAFQDHLANLLNGIVEKLHGPFEAFKKLIEENQAISPADVFTKAKDTGVAPFASEALAAGFTLSDQEAYVLEQVEVTVQAALDGNEGQTSVAYGELSRLYNETRKRLKDTAKNPDEQALFDFVFKIEAGANKRSDYLSRFASLGLAHQGFNKMLQVDTEVDTRTLGTMKTIGDKLQFIFNKMLTFFNGKLTHTYDGQKADEKLTALVDQLVGIEAKKRRTFIARQARKDPMESVDSKVRDWAEKAKNKIGDVAESDYFQKHSNAFVKAAGSLTATVAKDRVEFLLEAMNQFRDKNWNERQGILAGVLTGVRGLPANFQKLLRATKSNEKARKDIITGIGKAVMKSFVNEGANFKDNPADSAAVSAVFLRTDMAALLGNYTLGEMKNLMDDKSYLASEIASLEQQLGQFNSYANFYTKASKDLALYMAQGEVRGQHMLMNAHSIARMHGTPNAGKLNTAQLKTAEEVIDQLVSLYALQYTKQSHVMKASRIFGEELARTDKGNGVEMVLEMYQKLKNDSRDRLFQGSEALMMKGYTPEIYNPNIDVRVVNDEEGKVLEDLGYAKGWAVEKDPKDADQEQKTMYVMRDGGLSPWLSGIFSLTGMKAKGTREFEGGGQSHQQFLQMKHQAVQQMFQPDPTYDPRTVGQTYAAPTLNANGDVVGHRYLMQDKTKDNVLERDNRFDKLIGTMAGSIVDKQTSVVQNAEAVKALKTQYDTDYAENSKSYVNVGPNSKDPDLRELYRLMPNTTKEEIKAVWGKEGMMVRVDLLDINFGYRKLSAADLFEKNDRNKAEEFLVQLVEGALERYATVANYKRALRGEKLLDAERYRKRAMMVVRKNERIWQAVVQEMKDIIVVKTGTVMVGNILSNLSLLFMNGVSLGDIVKHHRVGMKAAMSYQKDHAELMQLQANLDTKNTQGKEAEMRARVVQLEDHIARNPVKGLIDAGLMPTIVEDVSQDEDLYSYKSRFVRKTEQYTNKLNPRIRDLGRTIYMAHDTKLYKGLSHVTQLSDFVARYTLYQHLTTKNNPMESEAAIQEASDAFVNYDIPMHRGIQYLDDMGIMPFTKYFMRIQKPLMKLVREHPTRVLGTVLFNNYFDLMPMVTDAAWIGHVGNNPLSSGALGFPSTLDELATVNAGLQLFK